MTGAAVAATGPLETLAGTDHKRVALRMGALAFAFFLAGGALALLMRAELAEPGLQIVSTGAYDELFRIHGSTMIYLVVTPAALALGLYLVPLQDARGAHAMRTLERLLRALALLRGAGRAPVPPPAAGEAVDPRCRELPHDRRAEALVALLLVLAGAAGAVFAVAIALGWSAQGQGLAAGAAALALAAALGLASRRVVVQETDVEQCPHRGDRGERREVRAGLRSAADGVSRRRLLAGAAGAAAAGIAAAAAAPFTALGPAVGSRVTRTPWRRGRRLVDATGRPITAASIAPGSLRTAFPEGADRRRLDTPVVVVRVDPATLDLPARPRGLGAGRARGLLEGLHARGLRGGDVPLADLRGPPAEPRARLPVPLLGLRRPPRGPCARGPGRPPASPTAAADRPRRRAARRRAAVRGARAGVLGGAAHVSPERDPVAFVDRRLGAGRGVRRALRYLFPDHWSFMLGEVALFSFLVLVATGVFLALFYEASLETTTYAGSYAPLRGQEVSTAYDSTLRLSFDVPGGLLMRQTHHWAAHLFVVAIVLHLARVFFTGAFRRPREINWVVGVTMLALALPEGYLGYSLPDDLLSGMGLAIGYSVVMSVPLAGGPLAFLLWGGEFPGADVFGSRMEIVHVFVLPAVLATLIAVHLAIIVRQHHTQFPGEGRTEDNVVGTPMWPGYALRSLSLGAAVSGVLLLLGGLVQINPIWQWGPYEVADATNGAQPDWYLGWLIGALRLVPNWEPQIGEVTLVPNPFWGGAAFPLAVFATLYVWPWVERRLLRRDGAEHHLLDRPRDDPARTAIGVAFLTSVVLVFVAGAADRILISVGFSYSGQIWFFRALVVLAPPVVFVVTRRLCRDLRARDLHPARGFTGSVVDRGEDGRLVVRSGRR